MPKLILGKWLLYCKDFRSHGIHTDSLSLSPGKRKAHTIFRPFPVVNCYRGSVVTGKSLGSPEKGSADKCPKKCLKIVRRGWKHNFRTFFWQFLPIWSMLLFGDPVQCSPPTMVVIYYRRSDFLSVSILSIVGSFGLVCQNNFSLRSCRSSSVIFSFSQKNPRVRKIRVRNSGAGNGCANFMGTWKKCVLSAGKTHVQKIPCFRGGVFWVWGGGKWRFYFHGRGDFSDFRREIWWEIWRDFFWPTA